MKAPIGWLREFVDFTAEVPRLADDLTLAGLAVDGIEGKGDDAVLDLDVTTNRVDGMNVYGVAREVSVLYGSALRPLPVDIRASTSGSGRPRPGCAADSSRSGCVPSTTWWTSPTT